MKQIDIIKTYQQKSCLVVDDLPDVRAALKRTLVDFGSEHVDMAGHAEEAIEMCERQDYDIVLADYNLGNGKNGQQLLEELRYYGLLKNTSLFIIITAENSSDYVLHALEYRPDDYLNKPITRESLRPRLDQALLKNEYFTHINQALDEKKTKQAIYACQDLLAKDKQYRGEIRKILGELLCKEQQFSAAKAVYESISLDKPPIWARVGLAKTEYGLKNYRNAENILLPLIDEHTLCVDARDLLAKIYEAQHKLDNAQLILADAIQLSPRSATRQREMGRVSHELGDNKSAAHAYRSAIKQSKNSCHEGPEDFVNLAQSLASLSDSADENECQTLLDEAMETLTNLDKKFANQPIAKINRRLVEAEIFAKQGRHEEADRASKEALAIQAGMRASAIGNTPTELCISCAKALMAHGQYDQGEKLLEELSRINKEPTLTIKIDKLRREPSTDEGIKYAAKLNKQGITHYQKKKVNEASLAFQEVLKELPNHIGLNLNLIQALISKSKESNIDKKELSLIENSFKRIGELADDNANIDRYRYLLRHYEKIKH